MLTNTNERTNGALPHSGPRQWVNLFEITNRAELVLDYRLVDIHGLPPGEHYDKQINQLVKSVAYTLQQPVALVHGGGRHQLAIPAAGPLPPEEIALVPAVARLVPAAEIHTLDLGRLTDATTPVAVKFLEYALRTPLMRASGLWSAGRTYYSKRPSNAADTQTRVDVYPGFSWS